MGDYIVHEIEYEYLIKSEQQLKEITSLISKLLELVSEVGND